MDFSKINWPEKLFVTGIDTDAGKSFATGWLAKKMTEAGIKVITQKFVQTGNKEFSEDIKIHRDIMGTGLLTEDLLHLTAPIIFSYPCSPDLAAEIDGRQLNLDLASEAASTLAGKYGHVIIEGAGGVMVPLKGEYLTIDYVKENNLPVVLVTNGRLGSINHTLLSLYALKQYHIDLFAVIYNEYFDKDDKIVANTKKYLKDFLDNHFPETFYMEMPKIRI